MTKIVINSCFGGFGLSQEAIDMYLKLKGLTDTENFLDWTIERDDPVLVEVVEKLGEKADTRYSDLVVVELPEGTLYRIDEYDGYESIETRDDIDWKVA